MRKVLLWLFMLSVTGLLVAAAAWSLETNFRRGRKTEFGSSYRSDAEGARAAFLLFKEMGHRPARLTRAVPPSGALLVSIEPSPTPKAADLQLRNWLEEGGILFLASSKRSEKRRERWRNLLRRPNQPLIRSLGLQLTEEKCAAAPSDAPDNPAAGLRFDDAAAYWSRLPRGSEVLVGTEEKPVLARFSFGRGRVYALAGATWIENLGLSKADHLALLVRTVVRADRRLYFDEYRHGAVRRAGLAYVVGRYQLVPAAVALVLFLGLVAWRATPRETELPSEREERAAEVRDSLIEARSALYGRTFKSSDVLTLLERDFRDSLSGALGEARPVTWREARQKIAGRHPALATRFEAILSGLERAKAQPPRRPRDLLPMARSMFTFVKELT